MALLSSGRLSTRRALLQAILFELGQPYRGMDEGELRLALVDYLTAGEDCPQGMVLLVDEAHTLPLRLLEEIRMITNLVRDGQPAVRLVLAGGCVLEERFASPKLESFSQRIVARCYLESFNRTETQQYIRAQIDAAGGGGEDALLGRGVPGRLSGHRRRAAADQPGVRSRPAAGLRRRPAADRPAESRRPGPICSSCPRPGTDERREATTAAAA